MTQDNQPLMQQLAEMSPGLLYLFDIVEQRTLYINPRSLELLGYAPETVLARGANFMAEVMHPDDLAGMADHFEQLNRASDGTCREIEYRMRHVDGAWLWFRSRDRVFSRTSTGQIHQILGIAQEITAAKRVEADRQQAELALRDSEKQFRSMADNSPVMVWVTDPTGHCTYLSPSWYDFTGQTEATGLGLGWVQAVHPDDQEFAASTFLEANQRCEGFRLEYRLRHKDGEYRWAIDAASPRLGADGQFQGYIGSVLDISDRKQIEETLRQRETELRLVTNAVPALISFVDSDQRYRFNNRGYEEWFGHPATEIYGKSIQAVLGETAYEKIRSYVEQVLTGQTVTFENQIPYKDGGTRHVTATYVPRFDPQGAVAGFVALINDISDRKQAEETLRESEDRLRLAISSAALGTWDWNLLTGELKWDAGCKAMFGLPADAETSIEIFFVGLHPEDRDRLQDIMQWSLNPASGGRYEAEYRTVGIEDGVERWIAAKGQVYFNAANEPVRFIGTTLDITDRKQVEAEREHLFACEQAAREQAETANRIKDEFLAVLSHELRSPLNPILGWSKLLQNAELDAAQRSEALKTIERNAKLQSQLIEDLLDISRIMQGKLTLTAAPTSLNFVIAAALETVRLAAEAKSIRVKLDLDQTIAPIWGDAARLQQVVWNLLNNAVKFTPHGGQVTVELRQVDRLAQIRVIDTGKGINPTFLSHVFEYFRQEDGSTTRRFGGLGLGLAIVRQIVEMHGGTVAVESQGENQGATFIVQLPTMQQATPIVSQPTRTQPHLKSPLENLQILLVDDDTDTREFQTFLLEQNGAKVTAVASGSAALQALKQLIPDVIVSDIGMAEMDGYMLMQQIRSRSFSQCETIPAIAVTAYAAEVDQQKALQAGFQAYLTKPIEPDELVNTLMMLTGQKTGKNKDERLQMGGNLQ
jgi:PAS domain S-box-containing protein